MAQDKTTQDSVIPEPTIRRLPWYLAYVSLLKEAGTPYVSSTTISKALNVDTSVIAKDLSYLHIKGKTKIEYDVEALEQELQDFLCFKKKHNAVIVGVGSLGRSLIQDSGLSRYGLSIVAGFDTSEDVVGEEFNGIPVYDVSELAQRFKAFDAEIGIVAVPVEHAQAVSDCLVEAGAKALWNFTPFRIKAKPGIVIQNTSIYAHLAVMYNRLGIH